jgi:hypothetical protein
MATLILVFLIVLAFSALTTYEVILLKRYDIDIFAHLKATWDAGRKVKFAFEAFGVIAFILVQPIVLTATTVWAFDRVAPSMAALSSLVASIFAL